MQKKNTNLEEILIGMKGKATRESQEYALIFDNASKQFVFGLKKKESEK